jgi:hypothetical protein
MPRSGGSRVETGISFLTQVLLKPQRGDPIVAWGIAPGRYLGTDPSPERAEQFCLAYQLEPQRVTPKLAWPAAEGRHSHCKPISTVWPRI